MNSKICALIRQTWYETAKRNLKPEERLRFYEMCLEFEFFGTEPEPDAPFSARLLFDMVRNDLEGDKEKAAARAERNRQNGSRGGRPKVTLINTDEENPQKPSGFFGNPNNTTYTNTQHNTTKETDVSNDTEDTHTKFCVCLNFFERGCAHPVDEAAKFWNYYEALGWKTSGGGVVVDRVALAKAWRLPDISKAAVRARLPYANMLHRADATEFALISDFVSFTRNNSKKAVQIGLLRQETAILLDTKYLAALKPEIPIDEDGKPFALEYVIAQGNLPGL